MGRLQMTINTHCLGILGCFKVVLNINSLEMGSTNSKEELPPRPAIVHVAKTIQPSGTKKISSTDPWEEDAPNKLLAPRAA